MRLNVLFLVLFGSIMQFHFLHSAFAQGADEELRPSESPVGEREFSETTVNVSLEGRQVSRSLDSGDPGVSAGTDLSPLLDCGRRLRTMTLRPSLASTMYRKSLILSGGVGLSVASRNTGNAVADANTADPHLEDASFFGTAIYSRPSDQLQLLVSASRSKDLQILCSGASADFLERQNERELGRNTLDPLSFRQSATLDYRYSYKMGTWGLRLNSLWSQGSTDFTSLDMAGRLEHRLSRVSRIQLESGIFESRFAEVLTQQVRGVLGYRQLLSEVSLWATEGSRTEGLNPSSPSVTRAETSVLRWFRPNLTLVAAYEWERVDNDRLPGTHVLSGTFSRRFRSLGVDASSAYAQSLEADSVEALALTGSISGNISSQHEIAVFGQFGSEDVTVLSDLRKVSVRYSILDQQSADGTLRSFKQAQSLAKQRPIDALSILLDQRARRVPDLGLFGTGQGLFILLSHEETRDRQGLWVTTETLAAGVQLFF